MDTSADALIKLREEILNQAIPLLDTDDIPAEDRFRLTLQIAQTKGTFELYEKAFRIAQSIEGADKLPAYLDLLSEVDFMIQEKTDNGPVDGDGQPSQNQEPSNQDDQSING